MTRRYLTSNVVRKTKRKRRAAKPPEAPDRASVRFFRDGKMSRTMYEDVAGDCLDPRFRVMHGRAEAKTRTRIVTKLDAPEFMEFDVRCRKCENCLKARAYHWAKRAEKEYRNAHRTWMGTLTLAPEVLSRAKAIVNTTLREKGVAPETLTQRELFLELDKLMYREFQKRFDLLRKTYWRPLLYLAVTEVHRGGGSHHGEPHWHVLLHEFTPSGELTYDPYFSGYRWNSDLKAKQKVSDPFWLAGFQHWKLKKKPSDPGYNPREDDPTYVTKYLSKDLAARVRASKFYGQCPLALMPPDGEVVSECNDDQ